MPSAYALCKHKTLCKRRSAIEAIIGHLKSEYRLYSNYLKGSIGDSNNALLAGMGFNLMRLVRELTSNFLAVMFWALCRLDLRSKLRLAKNNKACVKLQLRFFIFSGNGNSSFRNH